MQVMIALVACRCEAGPTRAGYRTLVKEALRRAADIAYLFRYLDSAAGVNCSGTVPSGWRRPGHQETIIPTVLNASHGSVSTMSLCSWYHNDTDNPDRVR